MPDLGVSALVVAGGRTPRRLYARCLRDRNLAACGAVSVQRLDV